MRPLPEPVHYIKQRALRPAIIGVITEDNPEGDWDLLNTTAKFSAWKANADGSVGDLIIDDAAATILDPIRRVVAYDPVAGDTNEAGTFYGQFTIDFTLFPSVSPLIVPTKGYIRIVIGESP